MTRRCSERRYFLRPSAETNGTFRYVLAVAAERYGVLVHAYCVMSNHFHLVVTDPDARLPEFHRYLDGLVARAMNCLLGRWEAFWGADTYSAVRLATPEAILEKVVYTLANPVITGLVGRGREWPGSWSAPESIGGAVEVLERPRHFFRAGGPLEATVKLRLCRPPAWDADPNFAERVAAQLRETEDRIAAERAAARRALVGVGRILGQKTTARPAPIEPHRAMSPRVACRDRWRRMEILQRLQDFTRDHRAALERWRAGVRDAVFPAGTWAMRVLHGAQCSPAP